MREASFTSYGRTEEGNRKVRLFKQNGLYVCTVEGYPSLTGSHPSLKKMRKTFMAWYDLVVKDWGVSDIDWGDMQEDD